MVRTGNASKRETVKADSSRAPLSALLPRSLFPLLWLSFAYAFATQVKHSFGLPRWLSGKESACQCRRCRRYGLDPLSGRFLGGGNDSPLQHSCLGNLAWQEELATVHGVSKSCTDWAHGQVLIGKALVNFLTIHVQIFAIPDSFILWFSNTSKILKIYY